MSSLVKEVVSMNLKCPKCKSKNIVKRGFRYNRVRKKQKYRCLECERWFIEADGFARMRHKPKDIARAIHMRNEGLSLFQVKNLMWQHDGVKVTKRTISQWTKKYSSFLKSHKFETANIERKTAPR